MNLQHAKQYFREYLAVGDYCAVRAADYSAEKNRLRGEWFGEGVARLNLRGIVGEWAFVALRDGNDPWTGKRLTLRRSTVRRSDEKRVASRRVFCDFATCPPNSGSLVAMLQENRIVGALERAVVAVRDALERFAEIRIRRPSKSAVPITLGLCPPKTRSYSRETN